MSFNYLYNFMWFHHLCNHYLGTVINNLSFQRSKPKGKLFSGTYWPLLMAAFSACSLGHSNSSCFHENFSTNFALPKTMPAQSSVAKKIYFIVFLFQNNLTYEKCIDFVFSLIAINIRKIKQVVTVEIHAVTVTRAAFTLRSV